jgi:hypothetical protein
VPPTVPHPTPDQTLKDLGAQWLGSLVTFQVAEAARRDDGPLATYCAIRQRLLRRSAVRQKRFSCLELLVRARSTYKPPPQSIRRRPAMGISLVDEPGPLVY